MGIFLRQSHNVKPSRWGSFADVQYAIRVNSEKIYDCNPDDDVLVMPLFWGFPLLDYSGYNNHGTNYGTTYKDGSLDFDGDGDRIIGSGVGIGTIGTGNYTVSGWIYKKDSESAGLLAFDSYNPAWAIDADEHIYIYDGGAKTDSTGTININEWQAISYVRNSTGADELIYYIEGVNAGTATHSDSIGSATAFGIAVDRVVGGTYDLNGLIDEVRIAKAAYTASQTALFYDRPWDLYRRVARPIWLIPSGIVLTVAAIDSAGLLDNINLIQKHNLAVQELSGAGSLDNVDLTQKHLLAVQELLSSGLLDNITLTQKHLLVVQELLSAGAIDNIELLVATLLTVSDMLSTGAIDNTALTQKHVLSISEVMSAGQLDGLALTQKHLLIIDSLISSGVIDNIRFDIAAGLIYISLSDATEYNISLSDATEYNISLSDATEYNISLSDAGGGIQQ